ncbi:hypothetical protein T492DRAFT_846733 [Pavlovales sp. CCMP2436]|nr:hypothetical protein T492DRAFT_846733 [Pavlovales sp. CCMP2436]
MLSGMLMFAAGLCGLIFIFKSPFYLVISIYAMLFGFMVVVVEHGTWLENVRILKDFYRLLDAEFHMLASQRGKGFFYSGAGVLTLFTDGKTISLVGGASICLIVAGVMHTFRIVHEDAINAKAHPSTGGIAASKDAPPPATPTYTAAPPTVGPTDLPPPPPTAGENAAATSEWNSIIATQHEREGRAPEEDWGAGTAREEASDRV